MCNLSEAIEEQGIEQGIKQGIKQGIEQGIKQGIKQGTLKTLTGLVNDGLISIEDAAKRMNLSKEEFEKRMSKQ